MIARLSILAVLGVAACGGRRVEEVPRWMTEKQTVRLEIVRTLLDGGETNRALELLRLIRIDGVDDPDVDLLQGVALRQQGMAEESERLLLQSQARQPRDPEVYRELCVLYADFDDADQAITMCRRATELDEQDAKAWNNYGYLLLTVGSDATEAMGALQKAVQLDATVARYRNNLGYAQAALGNHRAALRTFLTTGTPADAHYNVGTAFERSGDTVTALTYYRRALKMDAEHLHAEEAVNRLMSAAPPEEN